MKAVSILAPRMMEVVEIPEPKPAHNEVLLRVGRVGFCGSDLSTFRGANPLVSYPRIPGHEIQASVVALGEQVESDIKTGQVVTVLPYSNCGECPACSRGRVNACRFNQTLGVQRDGSLCEYITVPAEKLVVADKLGKGALALVEPLAVGVHAVERGRVEANETVLVVGCGMIGLSVIAAAYERGARVIGVDIDDAKLEIARLAGALFTINTASESLDARISELTAGDGPDVAFEAVGHPQTFATCIEHVRYGGRVVYIGYAREPVPIATKWYMLKELDVFGSRNATRADFERAIRILASGNYPVEQTITKTVPLEGAIDAMQQWDRNPSTVTKIHVNLHGD
jgi:2-desacetyl-2-hydroxyethyl bacteriochlorophyllide A dehydrogenase